MDSFYKYWNTKGHIFMDFNRDSRAVLYCSEDLSKELWERALMGKGWIETVSESCVAECSRNYSNVAAATIPNAVTDKKVHRL